MTAVANPPSYHPNNRSAWGASVSQGGLNAMNANEVNRVFMPRKSAQRANSSSSISSSSYTSSTASLHSQPSHGHGVLISTSIDPTLWGTGTGTGTGAARKKPPRLGGWPLNKAEGLGGAAMTRSQLISAATNGAAAPSMISIHSPSPLLSSQHLLQNPTQQSNGTRSTGQLVGEGKPVLYLLSMNGTFERKMISLPYYPETLRIGRQTNAKTVPTPANGFFDSKVLSRQHAEVWADRSGKVWIKDVKSSNGTFVNAARLSAENRDSEPHELQTQDHLELGIDIVSEDQKTVVHHKVAAKVEHAGFLGSTNNVLDMNFGDLDPANGAANGAMMVRSPGILHGRARTNSQGSLGSIGRFGPPISVVGTHMSQPSHQKPGTFWLLPVTTEHIVRRLTHETRTARQQTNELGRADHFFELLLSKGDLKEAEKPANVEPMSTSEASSTSIPFQTDAKPLFPEPPAPPPQYPLPEKPENSRPHATEPSSPSLKRSNTERPRSVPSISPIRQESSSQVIILVEALATAKKAYEMSAARIHDLEEMLMKEKEAREAAEQMARQLQSQSETKINDQFKSGVEGSVVEEAFEPPSEAVETKDLSPPDVLASKADSVDTMAISDTSLLLGQRLESMLSEMQEMKDQMESFKRRAETAESERDVERKTLAEMVEKIKSNELARSLSKEQARSPDSKQVRSNSDSLHPNERILNSLFKTNAASNGTVVLPASEKELRTAIGILSKSQGGHDPLLHNVAPYASMLGVVLIGMGLMAYMNGWQPPKVDR